MAHRIVITRYKKPNRDGSYGVGNSALRHKQQRDVHDHHECDQRQRRGKWTC